MNLGNKIRNIRYNHNISQLDMANILEINRNYLSRIENGKSFPTVDILTKLADKFNISIDKLLEINNDSRINKDEKIKDINKYLKDLDSTDLDVIINITSLMSKKNKV